MVCEIIIRTMTIKVLFEIWENRGLTPIEKQNISFQMAVRSYMKEDFKTQNQ